MKEKKFDFKKIVENICSEINLVYDISTNVHAGGNIRESGDVVENLIREKISSFLPERYMVKQGHIINPEGKISPQLDIIIFDKLATPKFFETSNETVFFPIESVLAVGEIKKTFERKHIGEFSKTLKYIKEDMNRKLIKNTCYGGLNGDSNLIHAIKVPKEKKYTNYLFSFILSVDSSKFKKIRVKEEVNYLPDNIIILNKGAYLYGKIEYNEFKTYKIEENLEIKSYIKIETSNVIMLSNFLNQLMNHLNKLARNPRPEGVSVAEVLTRG